MGSDSSSAQPGQHPEKPPPWRSIRTRLPVGRGDSLFGRVNVSVHTAYGSIFALDSVQRALPVEIAGEKRRYSVLLHQHFRALDLLEMLGQVGLAFRTQITRHGHRHRRYVHRAVVVHNQWRRHLGILRPACRAHNEARMAMLATAPGQKRGGEPPRSPV